MGGTTRMNVFSADHPMVSQPSCFDAKAYPWSSLFFSVLVFAVALTPLLYGYIWYSAINDAFEIGSETDPFPGSWAEFFGGVGVVFVFCCFCAFLIISAYRLLAGHFRSKQIKQPAPRKPSSGLQKLAIT
jgi:hypothetical protein